MLNVGGTTKYCGVGCDRDLNSHLLWNVRAPASMCVVYTSMEAALEVTWHPDYCPKETRFSLVLSVQVTIPLSSRQGTWMYEVLRCS